MNVLQTLGIENLCRQPLEVPLSVGGEWVAQLLGPKRAKGYYHKICNITSALVYPLCAAFQPPRVALSGSGGKAVVWARAVGEGAPFPGIVSSSHRLRNA